MRLPPLADQRQQEDIKALEKKESFLDRLHAFNPTKDNARDLVRQHFQAYYNLHGINHNFGGDQDPAPGKEKMTGAT
jgi:hypothetical protein